MNSTRRRMLACLSLAPVIALPFVAAGRAMAEERRGRFTPAMGPRARVMFVNDLSGDVDGLFAAVHALLSPSIDLRGIIGTATGARNETAASSIALASEMLNLTGRRDVHVFSGAERRMAGSGQFVPSPGSHAIIDEAMRVDTSRPLYVAVGGGLTEVATALKAKPEIATRMTVLWIGGTMSPRTGESEYNFRIDPEAARYVFNDSQVPIWQVPREAYASCVVSVTELQAQIAPFGRVGRWLYDKLLTSNERLAGLSMNTGETWTLGDNPLVLLAALADWVPSQFGRQPRYERTGSSHFDEIIAPLLDASGQPQPRSDGRKIRLYSQIDVRLMLADLYAKLQMHAEADH